MKGQYLNRALVVIVLLGLLLAACQQAPAAQPKAPAEQPKASATNAPAAQAKPAPAKEPYKVGVTGALTTAAAGTYGGMVEGMRLYVAQLNDQGGIDGHQIQLLIEDDRADPTQAAANVAKLAQQGISLVVTAGNNLIPAAVLPQEEKANLPELRLGSDVSDALPPNPHRLVFSGIYGQGPMVKSYPLLAAELLANYTKGTKVKLGLMAMDSPGGRAAGASMTKLMTDRKIDVELQFAPATATDLTGLAQRFKDAQVNWVLAYVPGSMSRLLNDTMRKIGWEGNYYYPVGESLEANLEFVKDPRVLSLIPFFPLATGMPTHMAIQAAAKKYGTRDVNSQLITGWRAGVVLEEIFKKTGYPTTTDKILDVLNHLEVSGDPAVWGGMPLKYTPQDHGGLTSGALFKWDAQKGALAKVTTFLWANSDGTKFGEVKE